MALLSSVQIDAFTVLLAGLFVLALLGALFLLFWLNDMRSASFGWWSAAFGLGAAATLLFLPRGFVADWLSIGLANALLFLGFGCGWQAARHFERRPPLVPAILVAPGIWLAACLVPGFLENVAARVMLASALGAPLLALTAFEFWRGRSEPLLSRWPVIVLFATFALLIAVRIPLTAAAPFPFGALPIHPGWLAGFQLVLFVHIIVLTVLLVSMSKERLELDQRTKAQTDALTGALNRRAFALRGVRLLQRHEQEREPLCLMFLDIDRFKALNDRHGHAGGDEVLVRFAALVHDNIRPTDLLFRIGGEEFCCILPYTGAAQGMQAAERIRRAFEETRIDLEGGSVQTTVSIGIACASDGCYDLDALMRRADRAVYEAKRQGRNRVVVADQAAAPARPQAVGRSATA